MNDLSVRMFMDDPRFKMAPPVYNVFMKIISNQYHIPMLLISCKLVNITERPLLSIYTSLKV